MTLTDSDYERAVQRGHDVALNVAIKRFRDEYGWTAMQVKEICRELLDKIDEKVKGQIETIAADVTRVEGNGGDTEKMATTIIAAMALVGAQVSQGFEMARRARRN